MPRVTAKVVGEKRLAAEMLKMADDLGITVTKTVPIAARVATRRGAELCEPGQRFRKIVSSSVGRKPPSGKQEVSDRTDTSRFTRHWVMFLRQGKKPFFVPVNPNPHSVHYGANGKTADNHARNAEQRKRAKVSTPPAFKYQQRRSTTKVGADGKIQKYDASSPSKNNKYDNIQKMRIIGRRGLAAESWGWLGKQIKGAGGKAPPAKHANMPRSGGSKEAREKHVRKWTSIKQKRERGDAQVILHDKLTYITKHYGNITNRIVSATAESLVGETKRRIIAREKVAQRRMNKAA